MSAQPDMPELTLPVLRLRGTPEAMGRAHGEACREAIRQFAAERVALAGDPLWAGRELSRHAVLAAARESLAHHARHAPDLTAELSAMAEACDLAPEEALVVSGFTDFVDTVYTQPAPAPTAADNCTAMLIPPQRAEHRQGLFAQTWDMHESATDHVMLIDGRPDGGIPFLAFTSMGCLGMIGMNAAGITVGINNLSGADGKPGVTWNFVVRRILQQDTFSAALACVTDAPLAGAHNYLIMDGEGQGANVEASATRCKVTRLHGDPLTHTNHCLAPEMRAVERARLPQAQASSEARLRRVDELLSGTSAIGVEGVAEITRDQQAICYRGAPPNHVATCGAVIARPATRELWALRGLPSEQRYRRFSLAPD